MGPTQLWKHLQPAGRAASLEALAQEHKRLYGKPLMIGVDVGPLMDECAWGGGKGGIHVAAQATTMWNLLSRLMKLLRTTAEYIFVFDGAERPPVKRGKKVKKSIWWDVSAKRLVSHCGFLWHQAPGEAEAELAEMNSAGEIDAVLTNDSDAFVFGAQRVFRKDEKFGDAIIEFTLQNIEEDCGLNRAAIFLYAILAGGDYDPRGLLNCGQAISYRIAKAGVGEPLFQMPKNIGQWKASIQSGALTPSSMLKGDRKVLAGMPQGFPRQEVVDWYRTPVTSYSKGLVTGPTLLQNWLRRDEPYIDRLGEFCRTVMCLSPEVVQKRFRKHLWKGVIISVLLSPYRSFNPTTNILRTGVTKITIAGCTWKKCHDSAHQGDNTTYPYLEVDTTWLDEQLGHGSEGTSTTRLWVPEHLLPRALRRGTVTAAGSSFGKGKGKEKATPTYLGVVDISSSESESDEYDSAAGAVPLGSGMAHASSSQVVLANPGNSSSGQENRTTNRTTRPLGTVDLTMCSRGLNRDERSGSAAQCSQGKRQVHLGTIIVDEVANMCGSVDGGGQGERDVIDLTGDE